jgi:hypothetical protein
MGGDRSADARPTPLLIAQSKQRHPVVVTAPGLGLDAFRWISAGDGLRRIAWDSAG